MAFGVTNTGFIPKRLSDCLTEWEGLLKTVFGNVDVSSTSAFGQFAGIAAKREADMWEVAESVYNAHYPSTAEGASLNRAVEFNAIERLPAIASTAVIGIYSNIGDTIEEGTQVSNTFGTTTFALDEDTEITLDSVMSAKFTIGTLVIPSAYNITVIAPDGTSHVVTYTSKTGDTLADVAIGLVGNVNTNSYGLSAMRDMEVDSDFDIYTAEEDSPPFAVTVIGANMSSAYATTPMNFTALTVGPTVGPAGSLTKLLSSTPNVARAYNYVDAAVGRNEESDAALRARRRDNIFGKGASTLDAISYNLEKLTGVIRAVVKENDTNDIVDGMPPHSIDCIVSGGEPEDIAETIFSYRGKAGGIATHGSESYDYVDPYGLHHTVRYSRPISKYIWVRYSVAQDPEAMIDPNYAEIIKEDCLAYCTSEFSVSEDIFIKKLYRSAYAATGVGDVSISVAITDGEGDTPTYVQTNLSIDAVWIPLFSKDRITVVLA